MCCVDCGRWTVPQTLRKRRPPRASCTATESNRRDGSLDQVHEPRFVQRAAATTTGMREIGGCAVRTAAATEPPPPSRLRSHLFQTEPPPLSSPRLWLPLDPGQRGNPPPRSMGLPGVLDAVGGVEEKKQAETKKDLAAPRLGRHGKRRRSPPASVVAQQVRKSTLTPATRVPSYAFNTVLLFIASVRILAPATRMPLGMP